MKYVPAWILGLGAAAGLLFTGCNRPASAGPRQAPPVQVVALAAARQPVSETLSRVGTLAANEMVEIRAEMDGTIQEINFAEGQPVEKGRLLIRLDDSKLQAALAESEAAFRLSEANYNRGKQLLEQQLISPQEYDQLTSTFALNQATLDLRRRQLQDTQVHAPFAGVVSARNVSPGQVITKNTIITWLIDLDPLKVELHVPERFLGVVRPGQTLEFPIAAYPGRRFRGDVFFVSPYVDPETRAALIKAEIPNPSHELKPGMLATLELTLQTRDNAVVIPEVGISQMLQGDRANVYIVDAEQTAQIRQISLGVRLPGRVEVTSGLNGGEMVILEGSQKIGPGSKVQLAPPEAAAPYRFEESATAPAKG
jgi:membrane fusion protein, multidrug efflux system